MLQTALEPYKIKGRKTPLSRGLSFAHYKTSKIKRSAGSLLALSTINLLNPILRIESVPVSRKDKYNLKDRFRFTMKSEKGTTITTECREVLSVNEKFRLLRKQDSSFFGKLNTDFVIATIVSNTDTASRWMVTATHLNASNGEQQKGKLIKGEQEISFTVANLMLREKSSQAAPEKNFSSLNMVYAFTYQNEIVAAVSVKEARRKFWIKESIDEKMKDAVASTAAILIMRRNLYR